MFSTFPIFDHFPINKLLTITPDLLSIFNFIFIIDLVP